MITRGANATAGAHLAARVSTFRRRAGGTERRAAHRRRQVDVVTLAVIAASEARVRIGLDSVRSAANVVGGVAVPGVVVYRIDAPLFLPMHRSSLTISRPQLRPVPPNRACAGW